MDDIMLLMMVIESGCLSLPVEELRLLETHYYVSVFIQLKAFINIYTL